MRTLILFFAATILSTSLGFSQATTTSDTSKARQDSVAQAKKRARQERIDKLMAIAEYPLIKGGKWSGVIPYAEPTEIPDPNREYKLLFELTEKNPDSLAKDINSGLDEVARVLNLHVASGVPLKKITPVVVIHGPGIEAVTTNERYQKRHSLDNPNLKIVEDLKKVGVKFIVCAQAMAFFDFKKEDLLPEIKISLTAQTVLSNYQLQGFVKYEIKSDQ